jgi:hypothetical protein
MQPPLAFDLLPDDDELHDRRAGADGQRRLAELVAGVAGLLELQRFEPIAEPARRTTGESTFPRASCRACALE